MIEIDDDGYVAEGTYAISVVRIGGAREDGTPVAFITSAVCDICHGWASSVWTAGRSDRVNDDIDNARIARTVTTSVYACPEHIDVVQEQLLAEYGWCQGGYEPDDLALKVAR